MGRRPSLLRYVRQGGPELRSTALRAGLAATLVVAIVDFVWRLGSSSLFEDEVYSWLAGNASLGQLFHLVRVNEVAPPTYYLMLHAWIRLFGSDSESVMRALSVVAAIGTAGAAFWVANLLAGRWVAVLAGLLVAVSPLVLEYGQEVRAYAWAMFAVTIAAGAVLQAERSSARRGRWLAFAAVAAVFSIWVHYSAAFVIAPLFVFVILDKRFPVVLRQRFAGAVVIGSALVLPFAIAQYEHGTTNAIAPYAQLTFYNLKRVIGAPFDRTYPVLSSTITVLAAAVVVAALVTLLLPRARVRVRHPRLLVSLAALPAIGLLALTVAGKDVLISRYDAVGVPFMAIAIACTVAAVLWLGIVLVATALCIAIPASITAHETGHQYPNTRAAMRFVARRWKPGEVLVIGTAFGGFGLEYYATHYLPMNAPVGYNAGFAPLFYVLEHPKYQVDRVAVITQTLGTEQQLAARFAAVHWRLIATENITGTVSIQVLVAQRRSSAH